MATHEQPEDQKKPITCITCSAPLPISCDGEVKEPGYFGGVSIGWKYEDLGDRDAEDISMILHHMESVTTALRDKFTLIDKEQEKEDPDVERGTYLKEARSLCSLLQDLHEEAQRRIRGLDSWLWNEIQAEERMESNAA